MSNQQGQTQQSPLSLIGPRAIIILLIVVFVLIILGVFLVSHGHL
jgi:hypothetical protein